MSCSKIEHGIGTDFQHWDRKSTCIFILFNQHNNVVRQRLLFPHYRWGNWDSERFTVFLIDVELGSSKAKHWASALCSVPVLDMGFPDGPVVKNLPANIGANIGASSGLGRTHGGGNGNLLWYSCWDNPMDRGPWRATVHQVTKVRHDLATGHTCCPG